MWVELTAEAVEEQTPKNINHPQPLQSPKEAIIAIHNKERMDDITGQLVGQEFQPPANISILYPNKEMQKSPMTLDTGKQTITYNNQTIQLWLPMWASIKKISFLSDTIVVEWSKFGISKNGSIWYGAFINGIDDVLKNKNTHIPSKDGDITMKIV